MAAQSQKAQQGAGLRFLTGPITSPSLAELMATILTENPQAKWHQCDPVTRDGARAGRRTGSPTNVIYHFDKADVVVSLDSDFLVQRPRQRPLPEGLRGPPAASTDDRKAMNRSTRSRARRR